MVFTRFRRAIAACWQRRLVEGQRRRPPIVRSLPVLGQPPLLESLEDRIVPSGILDAFNFAGAGGSQVAQNPDAVASNVTASPISRGAGLTASNQGNSVSNTPTTGAYGATFSSAAALNQYYQFAVTPQSGYSLSLSGISLNAYAQNGDSTFSGAVQYSLDGGNTFASVTLAGSLGGATSSSPKQASGSLSTTTALQNDTSTVLFRVYLFGAGNGEVTGLGQTGSNNDLQVTGTVSQLVTPSASGVSADNAGGGWTGSGVVGQYYDNTTFSGTPSFTRTDDRIDFASNTQAPGGSTAPGFNALGATNFSVAWTGSLITQFSQTYTFDGFAADSFNLQIAPAGTNNWTTVVNQTSYTGQNFSGTYNFTAGQTYNVKIQFVQYTGAWAAQLRWSSPSTPEAVINPLSDSGINAVTYDNTTYADAIKMGSTQWTSPTTNTAVATDAQGWPEADSYNIVWQGANGPDMAGTYLLQFNGLATVSVFFGYATFTVNGVTTSLLASGVGYDPTTNTTTALVNVDNLAQIFYLDFTGSQRTATSAVNTGVTNVHLMRPTSPGATTYYPVGTLFDANLEAEYANFTTERWLTANFDTTQVSWSQRVEPGFAEADYVDLDEVWEYEVELANETGKDLYITIPINANTQYVTDLAELIKYGSDGVNPYTSYQANPAYPGLNLNLHVYIEWSNETWNYSFTQSTAAIDDSEQAVSDYVNNRYSTADYNVGAAIDYDHSLSASTGSFERWTAYMTVQASNIFRSVWGNAAMNDEVRVVQEYQYDNDQGTALTELGFIYDYYDNGDGQQHVSNPEPVSYYLWGSGGATYYSSPDATGAQTAITIADASFETPTVTTNGEVVDPTNTAWTFSGSAGVYNGSAAIGGFTAPTPADGSQAAFIGSTGSITTTIDFTQTGTFALQLYGANTTNGGDSIRLYINGQEITPDYSNDPTYTNPFDTAWTPGQYMYGLNDTEYNSLGTAPFTISTTGNYTLQIVGTGTIGAYTFIDDVQVTSLAAIVDAGLPGVGQANGESQEAEAGYATELSAQATFAEAFGLHVVAYEGGWSLGGDFGATPLESYAKYVSSQATTANITSYDDFVESGGALYLFGTYEQWPMANNVTASSFPIPQAVAITNNLLPPTVTNGLPISAVLTSADATVSNDTSGSTLLTTGWLTWNVIVPTYDTYVITATTGTGGKALLLLDGATTVASGTSGGTLSGSETLAPGLHTIFLEATSGSFTLTQSTIAAASSPVAPTLSSTTGGNAEATLTWSAVSGATGYRVRYGTSSGDYSTSIVVGNVTTFTVPDLTNGQIYYFAVDAYDANSDGLPSNESTAIPLAPNTLSTVANWTFAGDTGSETSAPVSSAPSVVTVTSLVRASGLTGPSPTYTCPTDSIGSTPSNSSEAWAQSLAAGFLSTGSTANQYYQFTMKAMSGTSLSLQTLDFSAFFQNAPGNPRGAGIEYSVNGVNFTMLTATGTPSISPSPFTVTLSGQTALQNVTTTITIRICLFGSAAYETNGLGSISVLGSFAAVGTVSTTTSITSPSTLTTTTTTAVTFTATVTASTGNTAPSAGSVEFFNGTTLLAISSTVTSSGVIATFNASADLPAGTYNSIQAFYVPSSSAFSSSNSSLSSSTVTVVTLPVFSGASSASILGGLGSAQVQTFNGVAATGNPTFSLSNSAPAWVTINPVTGVLSFGQNATVPSVSTSTNTTLTIEAAISGGMASETFTVIVTPTVSYAVYGGVAQQTFSALPTTTQAPTGPSVAGGGPDDLTTAFPSGFGSSDGLAGWYATNINTGATTELLAEGEASGTTSAVYDFNNGTAGSQALGVLSDSATDSSFGETFVNNTGQTLTTFSLSYTGEEWWRGTAGGTQALQFGYVVDGGATVYVSSLGFSSPDTTATGGTALDGTLAANDVAVDGAVTGINWAPGQTLTIFWDKVNGTSANGDGLGIANVAFRAPGFVVNSVAATPDGVVLTFNAPINVNTTVLYTSPGNTMYGLADVTLVGPTGAARGSLVIDATNPNVATFIQTAGLLAAGTYTVTVTSAVTAISGAPLPATWSSTLTIATTTGPVLSVPSFARGPGQSVVITDNDGNSTGIPIDISNATNVTQASFTLTYDPTLLTIANTGALTLSAEATAAQLAILSYSIVSVDAHHSVLTVNLGGGTGLTTTAADPLVTIIAYVPVTAPYTNKAVLNLGNVVVDGVGATGVSGVEVAAYLGNVSGSGTISALDASLVSQVGSGSGTGFNAFKDLDPSIIGGVSGNSNVGAVDSSLINEAASGALISQIPVAPGGITLTMGGPDPYLYLSAVQAPAGGTVTETLYLDVTALDGIQLSALDEAIAFDASVMQVSNVRGASGLAVLGSYATASTTDNGAGILLVGQAFAGTGMPPIVPFGTDIAVLEFDVTLNANAALGAVYPVTLLQDGTVNGQTRFTAISDNDGALSWTAGMVPSNSGNAAIDGSVTVVAPVSPAVPVVVSPVVPRPVAVVSKVVKSVPKVATVHAIPVSQASEQTTPIAAIGSEPAAAIMLAPITTVSATTAPGPIAAPALEPSVVKVPTADMVALVPSADLIPARVTTTTTSALDEAYEQLSTKVPRELSWRVGSGSNWPLWFVQTSLIDLETKHKPGAARGTNVAD